MADLIQKELEIFSKPEEVCLIFWIALFVL